MASVVLTRDVNDLLHPDRDITRKVHTLGYRKEQLASVLPPTEWDPSPTTYRDRLERLSKSVEELSRSIPEGFPAAINSARVWRGSEIGGESLYTYELLPGDLNEIDDAVHLFLANHAVGINNPNLDQVTAETFRLPTLGSKLRQLAELIHFGQGFFVIRGLNPDRYNALERAVAYVGVTSYIGNVRACQDAGGSKMIHIKDRGAVFPGAEMRQAPYSNVAQPFHTDVCDVLAMYVQELAAEGGHFQLASSGQIYNEIAASRPDVICTLAADDWVFDKFTKPASWNSRPLLLPFGHHGPSFLYSRRPLTGSAASPRSPGLPSMTERQAEALDMVHFTAVKNQLCVSGQKGDIILVNNLAVMHARSAFNDGPGQKRHVMRLWLRNEELTWAKPDILGPLFDLKYSKDSPWCQQPVWHLEVPTVPERILARQFECS